MNFEIKICKGSVEGWTGNGFGLFADGYLITAFTNGTDTEANVEAVFKQKEISILDIKMKRNYELTLAGTDDVFDLYINKYHISRFTLKSLVYQNVMKVFKLEKLQ